MEYSEQDNIEILIQEVRTKYALPVMSEIWKRPKIRLKELADSFHMPPSNMKGVITKLLNTEPPLIYSIAIEGRTKGYVVSREVGRYLENYERDKAQEEGKEFLEEWIKLVGTEHWKKRLLNALQEKEDLTINEVQAFGELLRNVRKHGILALRQSREGQESPEICDEIERYFSNKKKLENAIQPLYDLEQYENGWQTAYRLIDYLFSKHIWEECEDFYQIYKAFDLEEDQYLSIKWSLDELIKKMNENDVLNKSKEKIYQYLVNNGGKERPLTFYISEKIYSHMNIRAES